MPPPEAKRQKRVEEVPVNRQPEACFDFSTRVKRQPSEPEDVLQDAGQNAVTHTQEGASPSSGTFMEDAGDEFQNMLEGIQDDIKKILHVRKMRFLVNSTASIKTFKENVEKVGKNQQEQGQNIFRQYCQDFQTFFQEWALDAKKTKEQEEKLANLFQEHREFFHRPRNVHNLTQNKIQDLNKESLKGG